jgi:hypothetical protein
MNKRNAGLLGALAGLALLSSAAVAPAVPTSQPSADALPANAKVAEYDRDHDRVKHVVIINRHRRHHPRHDVVIERERHHHHAKHVVIEREHHRHHADHVVIERERHHHRHHSTVGVGVEINR